MQQSVEESRKITEYEECSRMTITFDKKNIPTQLLTKLFGEFPTGVNELIRKSMDQEVIALDVVCYNSTYCNVAGQCFPAHWVCYYPDGNCYGPYLGSC